MTPYVDAARSAGKEVHAPSIPALVTRRPPGRVPSASLFDGRVGTWIADGSPDSTRRWLTALEYTGPHAALEYDPSFRQTTARSR